MIRTINNLVAIKPLPADEIRLTNGKVLYLDTRFEEYLNAKTAGIVVGLPEKLKFSADLENVSMPWITDVELQIGDRVVFNYLAEKNAKGLGYVMEDGVICIPYEQIYVAMRDNDIVCINGCIIVEPDDEPIDTFLAVPEMAKEKSKTTGTVVYAGVPNKGYRNDVIEKGFTSPDEPILIGQRIMFSWVDAIPLQPNAELRGEVKRGILYRMQHKDIIGIETN